MQPINLINSDALTWLKAQPDNLVAGVITDPPEAKDCAYVPEIIRECLRVSRGPVFVICPIIWNHEGAENARHHPPYHPRCDHYSNWLTACGPWKGVAPILCWRQKAPTIKQPLPLLAATGHKKGLKPVALYDDLLAVMPEGVILDPFCGEAPCAIACRDAGRKFIGVDIDDDAIKAATARAITK